MRLNRDIANSAPALAVLSRLAAGFIVLVRFSSRLTRVNAQVLDQYLETEQPVIIAAWHSRLLMLPYSWTGRSTPHALVSRHGDGELITRTVKHFGIATVRGSTRRAGKDGEKGGAMALRQLLALLRDGHTVAITPDGPRGPRMRLSAGTVALARLSGAPIIPVAYATSRRRLLRSWDRFHLALPFSRLFLVYGPALEVPKRLDEDEAEAWRQRIEEALNAVTAEADRLAGHEPVEPAPAEAPA